MFSLLVIFINVLVASNDFPDDNDAIISAVLMILNVVVLGMITGAVLLS